MVRIASILAVAALCGCGPIPFNAQVKGETVVEGSPLGQVLSVFPQLGGFANIDFNANEDFKNNDATRDRVKSMKVTSFTLRIVSPADQDFRFLESLEFAVRSGDLEQKIASKSGIDTLPLNAPNPTLTLDLVDTDLASFVRSPAMTIVSRGTGHQPAKDTRIEATVKFVVGVGL
ncbi:MAG: hypothetical protein ACOZQL_17840 [Myxococcota bacterium]